MGAGLSSHPLDRGNPPRWASEWGEDRYGPFAGFEVEGVVQLLRWIPEGRFTMGSPRDEPGRDDDETEHEVSLADGFWLADTLCTQELWQTVMGENPSEFVSPWRPMERVNWEDVQLFLETLDRTVPALEAHLPTEAQWEYACRAGTQTATYAGPLEILGNNHAPVLDEIAWYGGNSGVDGDSAVENYWDSSGWPEKQYPHKKAATHPVKRKRPNDWGLYDMLGNVDEWCADWYGAYPPGPREDPVGPLEGAGRVIRGGSWVSIARFVRAAYRFHDHPGARWSYLGFRLARGRE